MRFRSFVPTLALALALALGIAGTTVGVVAAGRVFSVAVAGEHAVDTERAQLALVIGVAGAAVVLPALWDLSPRARI